MSKPREFWIIHGSHGSWTLCRQEPETKTPSGNEYIHVREVTPADEVKYDQLKNSLVHP